MVQKLFIAYLTGILPAQSGYWYQPGNSATFVLPEGSLIALA